MGPAASALASAKKNTKIFISGPGWKASAIAISRARAAGGAWGASAREMYCAGGIWDTAYSHHNGVYAGVPATGKLMTLRDFDWWKREGEYLIENWVPIDMIDLFRQMDVDLMERLRLQVEARQAGRRRLVLDRRDSPAECSPVGAPGCRPARKCKVQMQRLLENVVISVTLVGIPALLGRWTRDL